eukprot:PITA_14929
MCDNGTEVIFRSDGCSFRDLDTGETVIKGKRTPNNLYIFEEGEQQCYLRKNDEHWLWHRRLGHLRFSQIRKACKYQAVRGLPDIKIPDNTICKSCQFGKQTRTNFSEKEGSASRPLELVHTDLCGPFRKRADEGILLGYSPYSKAYKCYNKRLERIVDSIDVVVDEKGYIPRQVNHEDIEEDEDYPQNQADGEEETYEEETHEEPEEQIRVEEKTPSRYVQKNHPKTQILGQKEAGVQTRRTIAEASSYLALLSSTKPQNVKEACKDEFWVKAMDEELEEIEKNNTWELVPRPKDKNVIGTKWIFKSKLNQNEEVSRNKARLVCKGYAQQEGIDFEENFAPVARL